MPRRTGTPADEQSQSQAQSSSSSQTPRPRVPSATGIVNFAPPPHSARRPSWIGPSTSNSTSNWTPALESSSSSGSLNLSMSVKGKQRVAFPLPEEEGSGSYSSSSAESSSGRQPGALPGSGEGGESSEDTSNFRMGMQIDMKGLVGDAVGNMSISPTSRDIVLAARRGLFIIDLESPLSVPRFLPQGGTWDVADVQWNPHPSRAEYIVSTSSEKLLIWNLHLPSSSVQPSSSGSDAQHPSSIQHILHAHYRAITDINWHPAPAERDLVVSTGVDSWVWAWDLRAARGGRAMFGLSAFNAGGTQVKWNRQDPHVLASSHAGEVLIWDRRSHALALRLVGLCTISLRFFPLRPPSA
ncbi:WD40-repeat-containing domain protein [Mycena latifolia]|nr:WD40-repeat-containing domain protein [Mycena latifolia]